MDKQKNWNFQNALKELILSENNVVFSLGNAIASHVISLFYVCIFIEFP